MEAESLKKGVIEVPTESEKRRDLKKDAVDIFMAAVDAVRPQPLIARMIHREGDILFIGGWSVDLKDFSRVFVVGGGKASAAMAEAVEEILGDRLTGGIIVTKYGHSVPLRKIRVREAGHPLPDENGVLGTEELLRTTGSLGEKDLVVCLLSGGGSALLSSFEDEIALRDVQTLSQLLLSSGVPIHEMNTIRKHLSRVGGGKLARHVHPATLVTLVLSDVIGDPLESIASGPTVPDPSTFLDVQRILAEYGLEGRLPVSIRDFFNLGVSGKAPETPKPADSAFWRTHTMIVGNNSLALGAAAKRAGSLGYSPRVLSSEVQGESREVASGFAKEAKRRHEERTERGTPECLLMGGETTVTIRGSGRGGRNQEFALSAALEVEGLDGVAILSGGTDGTDGPTDAAGAVVDGFTCEEARRKNVNPEEYRDQNDSYNFFRTVGGHLVTGPTLTNVMDIMVALIA